jgi:hypothetical protein
VGFCIGFPYRLPLFLLKISQVLGTNRITHQARTNPLECGGKRSATPPWIHLHTGLATKNGKPTACFNLPTSRAVINPKRRRASLAAALQGEGRLGFTFTPDWRRKTASRQLALTCA